MVLAVLCADGERPRNDVFLGPSLGAGAGISLLPPVPYAAPWFEVEAGYDRKLFEHGLLDLRGSLALGPAPDGGTVIGGYQALLEGGRDWFDTGFVEVPASHSSRAYPSK